MSSDASIDYLGLDLSSDASLYHLGLDLSSDVSLVYLGLDLSSDVSLDHLGLDLSADVSQAVWETQACNKGGGCGNLILKGALKFFILGFTALKKFHS